MVTIYPPHSVYIIFLIFFLAWPTFLSCILKVNSFCGNQLKKNGKLAILRVIKKKIGLKIKTTKCVCEYEEKLRLAARWKDKKKLGSGGVLEHIDRGWEI